MRDLPLVERTRQRSKLYLGRTMRSAWKGIRHPCIYMHVPKCGGTSVSEALYATVPLHKRIGVLSSNAIRRALSIYHTGTDDLVSYHDEGDHAATVAAFRETLVLMHIAQQHELIHGHFLFSHRIADMAGDRYKFVSILRDPVARTISNYRMAHRNGVFSGDFDAFLDSAMGRRMAQHALRFFSGRVDIAPGDESTALAEARANMSRFELIGFTEDMKRFENDFADLFGVRPRVGFYNSAPAGGFKPTPDQARRLEALCAPEIELNETARRRS